MVNTLLNGFLVPLAVLVSATSTTATAGLAWKLYQGYQVHDRALFGDEDLEGHDGVVTAVNTNTERSERNRRVLRAHDMVPTAAPGDFYRGNGHHDGPDADDGEA